MKVLLIEDNASLAAIIVMMLETEGIGVDRFDDGAKGFTAFDRNRNYDAVITDIKLPGMGGYEIFEGIRKLDESVPVIIMTAFANIADAVKAIKEGAFDYIAKPFDNDEFLIIVRKALEYRRLRDENAHLRNFVKTSVKPDIIGESVAVKELERLIGRIAPADAPVMITGESGTGKELVAREIHALSGRADKPFITINCAAIPESLFESELFGCVKGAFTGADRDRKGKILESDGGTIFLDEIGELPPSIQAKLLRFLQESEIQPLGSNRTMKVNTRVISATNRKLADMVKSGSFRDDLYYRLNVLPVEVPALRERRDDIPLLVAYFLKKYGRKTMTVSSGALDMLTVREWPGNIRELENMIYRLCIMSRDNTIGERDLQPAAGNGAAPLIPQELPADSLDLEELEKKIVLAAIEKFKGNKTKAAAYLKLPRHVLIYRLEKWGMR